MNDYYDNGVDITDVFWQHPKVLSKAVLLDNDGRDYNVELWIFDKVTDPYRILAGCRFFTIPNAIRHWSDPARWDQYFAAIGRPQVRNRLQRLESGRKILAAVRKLALELPPQDEMSPWPSDHWIPMECVGIHHPGLVVETDLRRIRTRMTFSNSDLS